MDRIDREQHDRFLRLFLEHEEALRLFVRSLLFSQEESREVMQEIAVVLWRKFDDSLTSSSFRRWAFGVARMEVLAFRRDRARDRHVFSDDVSKLLETSALEHSGELEAERDALAICLKKLPKHLRELVRSTYESDVKVSELAGKLNQTPMALYKKLHRARQSLMECTQRQIQIDDAS